jgi:hypothetical protein
MYTAYFEKGLGISRVIECYYTCSNGFVIGPFDAQVDPSLSAAKGDLERQLCGIAPPTFTPMEPPATTSPTPAPSATLAESPTAQASSTSEIPLTGQSLLTGNVTMCDTGVNLISFRIVQPPPDLTGKTLTVQIAEQESACYVNQTNPSLMTCTIPVGVTFPARVVVSLDGVVMNDFTYDGLWCAEITTPVPATTP